MTNRKLTRIDCSCGKSPYAKPPLLRKQQRGGGGTGGCQCGGDCGGGASCGCSSGQGHACQGHSHSLCRLHGLVGLYLALFVVFHLCVNGLVIFPAQYRLVVERMHGNKLLVGLVSLLLVMIPLGVQVTTGVLRLLQGGFRGQCRHGPVPPWVQRLSGLVVLIFLPTHLLVTKLVAPFSASAPLETTSRAMIFPTGSSLINGVLALGGLVALWAIVVHVANGVSTALRFIRSNPSQRAQVSWRILCVVGGIMLLTVGLSGWVTFLSASRSTHSVPSVESKTHG